MAEKIYTERMTTELEGDFVVFLIGMRINKPLQIGSWLPVTRAMPKMLIELSKQPEMGLLGFVTHIGYPVISVTQYWRSFEHLNAYASNRDAEHFPAWVDFNKRLRSTNAVGIWHETYKVAAGQHETVYVNMPAYGLGKAGKLVPAIGRRSTAAKRINSAEAEEVVSAATPEGAEPGHDSES